MYGFEPPLNLKPDWVASVETCPAIDGIGHYAPGLALGKKNRVGCWRIGFLCSTRQTHFGGD